MSDFDYSFYQQKQKRMQFKVTRRVSYKKQELLTFHEHLGSPPFLVGSVLLIFLASDIVIFALLVFVLFCVSHVASFTGLSILDCPIRFSLTFIEIIFKSIFFQIPTI